MKRAAAALALAAAGCLSGAVSPYPQVDAVAPDVVDTTPRNGDTAAALFGPDGGAPEIDVVFSEPMDHGVLTSGCVGVSSQTGVCGPAMVVHFGPNEAGRVEGTLAADDFDDADGQGVVRRTRLRFSPTNWDAVSAAAVTDGGTHGPLLFDARVSGAVTDLHDNRMGHDVHFSWVTAAGP